MSRSQLLSSLTFLSDSRKPSLSFAALIVVSLEDPETLERKISQVIRVAQEREDERLVAPLDVIQRRAGFFWVGHE